MIKHLQKCVKLVKIGQVDPEKICVKELGVIGLGGGGQVGNLRSNIYHIMKFGEYRSSIYSVLFAYKFTFYK